MNDINDNDGYWAAGLIDGEGCFAIYSSEKLNYCYFVMNLRIDDMHTLEELQSIIGVGKIYTGKSSSKVEFPDVCKLKTNSKADAQKLVNFLDRYPLRSKKAADYAIWREAVLLHKISKDYSVIQPAFDKARELLRQRLIIQS